jgi:hypothetical protein
MIDNNLFLLFTIEMTQLKETLQSGHYMHVHAIDSLNLNLHRVPDLSCLVMALSSLPNCSEIQPGTRRTGYRYVYRLIGRGSWLRTVEL